MKYSQVIFPKFPVQHIAKRIINMRQITRIDQQLFMSALLAKASLSLEEQILVQEIHDGVNRGLIRVVE